MTNLSMLNQRWNPRAPL